MPKTQQNFWTDWLVISAYRCILIISEWTLYDPWVRDQSFIFWDGVGWGGGLWFCFPVRILFFTKPRQKKPRSLIFGQEKSVLVHIITKFIIENCWVRLFFLTVLFDIIFVLLWYFKNFLRSDVLILLWTVIMVEWWWSKFYNFFLLLPLSELGILICKFELLELTWVVLL